MFSKTKDSAIRLLNFSQEKNSREVIAPVTMSFPKARIGVVVGKSESQKGSFLRTISGFDSPATGDIVISNKSLRNSGVEYKRNVFLVSPYVQFNLPCSLSQVPGILTAFYDQWDFVAYRNWVEYLGLPGNVMYSELPNPQKMKALIAIAMASSADVLIFEDIDTYLQSDHQRTLLNSLQMKSLSGGSALIGSRRLTRWVNSDVDLYSFKGTSLIQVDTQALKQRLEGPAPLANASLQNGWPRYNQPNENTQTMTMTFLAT